MHARIHTYILVERHTHLGYKKAYIDYRAADSEIHGPVKVAVVIWKSQIRVLEKGSQNIPC
jgi:hypothetical protein